MNHINTIFTSTKREGSLLPFRGTPKSAGVDVYAYIEPRYEMPRNPFVRLYKTVKYRMQGIKAYKGEYVRRIVIHPHQTVVIDSGIRLREALPHGYYMEMHLRSSLRKRGLSSQGTGIIDGDYLDEIKHLVCNTTDKPIVIEHGERVSQFIVLRHHGDILGCPIKDQSRKGGFGSTGK